MSLTPASGAEARRSRGSNGRRPRARVIELSRPADAPHKSSPEGLVKRRPDDQPVEDLLSPVVPPPPPWGEDTTALTALVSEALSPQTDLAIGVGVSVDLDDDDDFDLSPPPAPLASEEEPQPENMAAAEPDVEELDDLDELELVEVEVAPSEASRVAPPPPPSRATEELELEIDLEDLSQRRQPSKRLVHYLRDRFIDDPAHVDVALAAYRGKYARIVDYAQEVVDGERLADWLLPYVDVEALARDWLAAGVIWVIDDPGGNGEEPGLHIFLS
jgi:hypothetical protein